MSTGSFCERHERWNPDGVCPYCEPAPAKVPEVSAAEPNLAALAAALGDPNPRWDVVPETKPAPTIVGLVGVEFRASKPLVKRCACDTVDLDDGRFKEPYTDNIGVHGRTFCDRTPARPTPARPWLPLLEALTKPNPLLVDKPYEEPPTGKVIDSSSPLHDAETCSWCRAGRRIREFAVGGFRGLRFMGVPITVDPLLKPDEFRFEEQRCACGACPLSSNDVQDGRSYSVGYLRKDGVAGIWAHSYARCVTER